MSMVGTEATLQEILGYLQDVESDTNILAGGVADNWDAIWKIVQAGKLAQLPVGTQIVDKWALSDSAADKYDAVWDVVHHYANGDVALNWHYALPNDCQFDAPEAIYYAPSGGLAAGTYYISIGTAYGGWSTSKHIQFTLSAAMAEGDQLYIDCGGDSANDPTNNRNWYVYAQGSTTAKQSGKTSNGTSGTSLGTIGATNAHKPEGNLNGISVVVYGYGRWSQSAIRQWLNSEAVAGYWWTPQNPWDRPPGNAATVRGFLAGCSPEFLEVLKPVEVITALNTVQGFTDQTETTQDRIFLPALDSWYIQPQYSGEDDNWDYYKALAAEAGLSGKFQTYPATYDVLKKYSISAKTSAVVVWLRSAGRGGANYAWAVHSSGSVSNGNARYALRGCPACKIIKST